MNKQKYQIYKIGFILFLFCGCSPHSYKIDDMRLYKNSLIFELRYNGADSVDPYLPRSLEIYDSDMCLFDILMHDEIRTTSTNKTISLVATFPQYKQNKKTNLLYNTKCTFILRYSGGYLKGVFMIKNNDMQNSEIDFNKINNQSTIELIEYRQYRIF
ncbi:MAG: hypothetical protein JW874_14955 [Spirochaetales bacterium]|nr:hypothetical protein [Spirochaetales bacterium]